LTVALPPVHAQNLYRSRFRALIELYHGSISEACRILDWHVCMGSRRTLPLGIGVATSPLDPGVLTEALRALGIDPDEIHSTVLLDGDVDLLRWIGEESPEVEEAAVRARRSGRQIGHPNQPVHTLHRLLVQGLAEERDGRIHLTSDGRSITEGAEVVPENERSLRDLRVAQGLTQDQCALFAGVTRQTWSHYETGRTKMRPDLRIELLEAIEKAAASAAV
jgi:DNA-binding XRE family transcriptional regulator